MYVIFCLHIYKEKNMKKVYFSIFIILALLLTGCSSPQKDADNTEPEVNVPETPKSRMVAPTLYSPTLQLDWNYTVYLPRGYDDEENKDKTYPVIYLLHGAYGNHRNLVERFPIQAILDQLIEEGKLEEVIVVFPDGFNSYYIDGPGVDMETAIINDLIPTIESLYRADGSREKRVIGGISMGGYGAARFALKYPELFSVALLISPGIWETLGEGMTLVDSWHVFADGDSNFSADKWNELHPYSYFKSYVKANLPVQFFIISGEADTVVEVKAIKDFAENLKVIAEVTESYHSDGIHAWTFWETATTEALEFIGNTLEK